MTHIIYDRNNKKQPFKKKKIAYAVFRAFEASEEGNWFLASSISESTTEELERIYFSRKLVPTIDQIQDVVELNLLKHGFYKAGKQYIIYRYEKDKERGKKKGE